MNWLDVHDVYGLVIADALPRIAVFKAWTAWDVAGHTSEHVASMSWSTVVRRQKGAFAVTRNHKKAPRVGGALRWVCNDHVVSSMKQCNPYLGKNRCFQLSP